MQVIDLPTKKVILRHLGLEGRFTSRTFDLIRTATPVDQLTVETVSDHLDTLELIELKGSENKTGKVRDASLKGHFFGATANEFAMAEAVGPRYKFAFVILNDMNDLPAPFHVLLTLAEVESRIKNKRVQYQINFR